MYLSTKTTHLVNHDQCEFIEESVDMTTLSCKSIPFLGLFRISMTTEDLAYCSDDQTGFFEFVERAIGRSSIASHFDTCISSARLVSHRGLAHIAIRHIAFVLASLWPFHCRVPKCIFSDSQPVPWKTYLGRSHVNRQRCVL